LRGLSLAQSYEGLPRDAFGIAWSADGSFLAAAGGSKGGSKRDPNKDKERLVGGEVAIWSNATGRPHALDRPSQNRDVMGLAWHPIRPILAYGSSDGQVYTWDMNLGGSCELFPLNIDVEGQVNEVRGLAWSPDGSMLAVTYEYHRTDKYTSLSLTDSLTVKPDRDLKLPDKGGSIGIWDFRTQTLLRRERYDKYCNAPFWSPDGQMILSPGSDGFVYVHASDDLRLLHKLRGNNEIVYSVSVSADSRFVASASYDKTVRVWDLAAGKEIVTLEGMNEPVTAVQFSPNGHILVSKTHKHVYLWRCRDWECVAKTPPGDYEWIGGIAFHPSLPLLAVKDNGPSRIDCYHIDYALLGSASIRLDSRRYVNAKVVLLGDTGVGKSGLGLVLSGQKYQPTDSTHGRRVWTFDTQQVESPGLGEQTREVLLWDLAGQPGYRLVHQLHLNEIAVALLVFDSRSETDPFSGVKHWVRALAQARQLEDTVVPLRTYLVAARADRGGVAVSRERIQAMIDNLGLDGFFETSAKEGWQITELKTAIRDAITWDALPMVSSSVLFDSIKQFLMEEKKQGGVLCTADDLFRGFLKTQSDNADHDNLRASFETCIGRVESRDLIRRLHFGGLVLLQPELLDAYASALVQAAKEEPDGLGFIREDDALTGRFRLAADERMADQAQEKLLLIATVEELLRHEIALKETTDQGVDLVFPSQFTREQPDSPDIPGKQVTFAFDGSLHSIYASLAVRLAHSSLFRRQTMWQNAASYTATVGGVCGIQLRELEEGRGELTLFYDELAGTTVRSQFETYVAGHLQLRALPGSITRRAIRSCLMCGYVLPDNLIRGKLGLGMITTRCPLCEKSIISLRDDGPSTKAEAAVSEMNRSADEHRDRSVAATQLKGKIETGDYDVFLCHNSKDKPYVIAISERLRERGILPWLDIWEIRPGMRWQKELQRNIKSVKSAAVFIGARGAGPWQELEVESLLQEFAKRNRPIIPVILEGRLGNPRLPAFLNSWHMVDMRNSNPDPFEQLVWGITGEKSDRL
jgi:WD40 repeat protein